MNVKKAVEYFAEHYQGSYKVVKYAAVNKQSANYDKNSDTVKNFISNINVLFADSKDADLMEYTAWKSRFIWGIFLHLTQKVYWHAITNTLFAYIRTQLNVFPTVSRLLTLKKVD